MSQKISLLGAPHIPKTGIFNGGQRHSLPCKNHNSQSCLTQKVPKKKRNKIRSFLF
jgi:hypothetical protein